MYNVRVEVSPALTRWLNNYPQLYEDAKKKAINKSLDLLQETSFKKAPYRFGTLRREIKQRYNESKIVAGTDQSAAYALIQDIGGTIRPKDHKGWLRFKTKDGSWHTVKQVKIPGKHYFFENAAQQQGKVLNYFVASFKELIAKL